MGLYLYLGFSSQFIVYTLSFNFLLFISSVVPISYYGYVLIFWVWTFSFCRIIYMIFSQFICMWQNLHEVFFYLS